MKSQATSSHGGPFVLEILEDFSNRPFGPLVFSSSHSYVSKSPMRSEPTATPGPSLDPRKSRTQAPALCTLDPQPSCVVVLCDVQVLWVINLYFLFPDGYCWMASCHRKNHKGWSNHLVFDRLIPALNTCGSRREVKGEQLRARPCSRIQTPFVLNMSMAGLSLISNMLAHITGGQSILKEMTAYSGNS